MTLATASRATTIYLRVPRAQCVLIDQAARLNGMKRAEFILDAACEKARQRLSDHTVSALDAPLENHAALARLLNRRPAWEPAGK